MPGRGASHAKPPSASVDLMHADESLVLTAYGVAVDGAHRPTTMVTPRLPPGWLLDVNDPVLLSYDPYFGTERKDAVAPSQFTESDRTYYAEDALPVCRADAFALRSLQPAASEVRSDAKGTFLIASRAIKAGEVVGMDSSTFTNVNDPRAFLYPPPRPPGRAGSDAVDDAPLFAATKRIMKNAMVMKGFPAAVVATQRLQAVCSLLISHGDVTFLPRCGGDLRRSRCLCACGAMPMERAFPQRALHRSQCAERDVGAVLRDWWRLEYNNDAAAGKSINVAAPPPPSMELQHVARMVIQLMPVELLRESVHVTSCCGSKWKTFGFLARVGLHRPEALAAWFSAWDANAVTLQVPDLLERSGMFPFVRLLEHACRPNCAVVALDCPATHTSGRAAAFHYDTKSLGDVDPYSDEAASAKTSLTPKYLSNLWWPCETTTRIFSPSVVMVTATRDIGCGEALSIAYFPCAYRTQPERAKYLQERFRFTCTCRWCTTEPDLARGFHCPKCEKNQGVVCPRGDGTQWALWECLQCGYHPDAEATIPRMLDAERAMLRIKADKARGLVALLEDPLVHYSHAAVYRKLDAWSEQAWREQDATLCIGLLEALQRCARRVFDPCDVSRAQYHEFLGQVHHAVGNAHTARHEYFVAYQIRLRSGSRLAHWTRKTQFMAAEKSLADFLDSR